MTSDSLGQNPRNRHNPETDYRQRCKTVMDSLDEITRKNVEAWLEIGNRNQWIYQAGDPPFDALSFRICKDINDLAEQILEGNWCLGRSLVLGDICLINQVNGGDEWLTIKGKTAFESITVQAYDESLGEAEARFRETIARIQAATEDQCKKFEY